MGKEDGGEGEDEQRTHIKGCGCEANTRINQAANVARDVSAPVHAALLAASRTITNTEAVVEGVDRGKIRQEGRCGHWVAWRLSERRRTTRTISNNRSESKLDCATHCEGLWGNRNN